MVGWECVCVVGGGRDKERLPNNPSHSVPSRSLSDCTDTLRCASCLPLDTNTGALWEYLNISGVCGKEGGGGGGRAKVCSAHMQYVILSFVYCRRVVVNMDSGCVCVHSSVCDRKMILPLYVQCVCVCICVCVCVCV